jgi:integrase
LYRLALETGMRQGELLALKWQNVDLERGALSVKASLRYFHGRFVFSEPKTKSARRPIPLTPRTIAALHAHRARQLEE